MRKSANRPKYFLHGGCVANDFLAAIWVAGLVNPIPALGVCREVRPRVLEAADGLDRLKWVHFAILDSLKRLKSMPPGPFECEPPPGVQDFT